MAVSPFFFLNNLSQFLIKFRIEMSLNAVESYLMISCTLVTFNSLISDMKFFKALSSFHLPRFKGFLAFGLYLMIGTKGVLVLSTLSLNFSCGRDTFLACIIRNDLDSVSPDPNVLCCKENVEV